MYRVSDVNKQLLNLYLEKTNIQMKKLAKIPVDERNKVIIPILENLKLDFLIPYFIDEKYTYYEFDSLNEIEYNYRSMLKQIQEVYLELNLSPENSRKFLLLQSYITQTLLLQNFSSYILYVLDKNKFMMLTDDEIRIDTYISLVVKRCVYTDFSLTISNSKLYAMNYVYTILDLSPDIHYDLAEKMIDMFQVYFFDKGGRIDIDTDPDETEVTMYERYERLIQLPTTSKEEKIVRQKLYRKLYFKIKQIPDFVFDDNVYHNYRMTQELKEMNAPIPTLKELALSRVIEDSGILMPTTDHNPLYNLSVLDEDALGLLKEHPVVNDVYDEFNRNQTTIQSRRKRRGRSLRPTKTRVKKTPLFYPYAKSLPTGKSRKSVSRRKQTLRKTKTHPSI